MGAPLAELLGLGLPSKASGRGLGPADRLWAVPTSLVGGAEHGGGRGYLPCMAPWVWPEVSDRVVGGADCLAGLGGRGQATIVPLGGAP